MHDKEITEWVTNLKKSPIFNMSLSSKELFHSNFIAWILETYPVYMGQILKEDLKLDTDGLVITNVKREEKNIDLSFSIGKVSIYIENKVKSIAYKNQLNKYASYLDIQNNENSKCIILSMSKPTFLLDKVYEAKINNILETVPSSQKNVKRNVKWEYISYKSFVNLSLKSLCEQDIDLYHKKLIEDYIEFINILDENIISIIPKVNIIKLYRENTAENNLLKDIQQLRMHDLFQKAIFEHLKKDVELKLKETKSKSNISVDFGMTNAVGLLHVSYKYNDDFSFGIQIQGNQYRKFIEGNNAKTILKKATEFQTQIFSWSDYLINSVIPNKDNKKLIELVERNKINDQIINVDFNRYYTERTNSLFLYKYVKLDFLEFKNKDYEKENDNLVNQIVSDISIMIQSME